MRKSGKKPVQSLRITMESSAILREVVLVLSGTLTPRGVDRWLTARNQLLHGRRPIDVLAEGKAKSVRDAGVAYVEGAYV